MSDSDFLEEKPEAAAWPPLQEGSEAFLRANFTLAVLGALLIGIVLGRLRIL